MGHNRGGRTTSTNIHTSRLLNCHNSILYESTLVVSYPFNIILPFEIDGLVGVGGGMRCCSCFQAHFMQLGHVWGFYFILLDFCLIISIAQNPFCVFIQVEMGIMWFDIDSVKNRFFIPAISQRC
jgi:hypothetical protein